MVQVAEGIRVSSHDDKLSGVVAALDRGGAEVVVECRDQRRLTFSCETPPRDADVVQNPLYYHSLFRRGTIRGGIYWNCDL